jgi:hypothetical protein
MTGELIGGLFSGADDGPLFLVECYWPGVSVSRVAAADAKTVRALEAFGDRTAGARHLGSIFVPGDELLLRVFAGGSTAIIEKANTLAGVPVERVVAILALPSRLRPRNRETPDATAVVARRSSPTKRRGQ